ncbi:hypothetical protein HDU91_005248, partial [Kappamyces sp. JEL0680]
KKQVEAEIEALESELKDRHAKELLEWQQAPAAVDHLVELVEQHMVVNPATDSPASESVQHPSVSAGGSKSKKRKNKKMQELEAMRKEAEEEAQSMPNWRLVEDEAIDKIALELDRIVVPVPADGHCLYYSLARQLLKTQSGQPLNFKELRRLAADHMRKHPDDFLPFLVNQEGELLSPGTVSS